MEPVGVGSSRDVRPYWGRVMVVESPLDDAQTPSGLIVPRTATASDATDPLARRGVVQAIECEVYAESSTWRAVAENLKPGTVVYFRNPTRIQGDVLTVEFNDVLAFEP